MEWRSPPWIKSPCSASDSAEIAASHQLVNVPPTRIRRHLQFCHEDDAFARASFYQQADELESADIPEGRRRVKDDVRRAGSALAKDCGGPRAQVKQRVRAPSAGAPGGVVERPAHKPRGHKRLRLPTVGSQPVVDVRSRTPAVEQTKGGKPREVVRHPVGRHAHGGRELTDGKLLVDAQRVKDAQLDVTGKGATGGGNSLKHLTVPQGHPHKAWAAGHESRS